MKRFGVAAFLALMITMTAQAQDTTIVLEAVSDSTVEMVEHITETEFTSENPYYEAADARFAMDTAMAASKAKALTARGEQTTNNRIWVIIILVIGGLISAAVGYAGYVNYVNNEKPIIFDVWPVSTKGKVTMNLAIPDHSFMAELTIFNSKKEKVFGTNIDNAASQVDIDLSDLEAGKYKAQLIAEKGNSQKVDIVRL